MPLLTVTLDNHLIPAQEEELGRLLKAFTMLQEKGMGVPEHALFSWSTKRQNTDSRAKGCCLCSI